MSYAGRGRGGCPPVRSGRSPSSLTPESSAPMHPATGRTDRQHCEISLGLGPPAAMTQSYIDIGKREGATLVAGGARSGELGNFVEPTVFAGVDPGMRIAQQEIFGPVASVVKLRDENFTEPKAVWINTAA